jgi:hypothetical protein
MSNSNDDIDQFVPTLFARTDHHRVIARLHENRLSIGFYAIEHGGADEGWDFKGHLKWDGCLNWMTNPNVYAHLCEVEDINRLSAIFAAVGRLAVEHVKDYEGDFGTALAGETGK